MKGLLAKIISMILLCIGGSMGFFAAAGLTVMVWGEGVMDRTLYDGGGKSVFVVGLVTIVFGIYIGCVGVFHGIIRPLCSKLNIDINDDC